MISNNMRGLHRFFGSIFGGKFPYTPAGLLRWQVAAGLILAAEAIAVGLLSAGFNLPLYALHLGTDALRTQLAGHKVASLTASELMRVNFGFGVAAMLGLTALVFLALAIIFRRRYIKTLENKLQPWRWFVIAVAGIFMFSIVEVLVGVEDIASLSMVKACVVVGALLLLALEQLLAQRNRQRSIITLVAVSAIIAGVMPWLVVIGTITANSIFGVINTPPYIWGFLATIFLSGILILGNAWLVFRKLGKWATYAYSEYWFIILIVLAESAFAWEVFAAILRP